MLKTESVDNPCPKVQVLPNIKSQEKANLTV